MNAVQVRVLVLSMLVTGAMVLSALTFSSNASAAGVSGTWVSRIPGEGYSQTYIGPYGFTVTDYFDVELELTESGGVVFGTLRSWNSEGTQEFDVDGTVSGSVFYMTAYFGWDGVNYLTPTYTLTIDGSTMFGSGSYENVGVMITGTFDIEKEGFTFSGVGGLNPIVSAIGIALGIVAIVVAVSPPKAPKGVQPGMSASPYAQQQVPSQQWTTDTYLGHPGPDVGVPVGGVGLHYPNERPLTEPERESLKAIARSPKVNAVGLAVMSMVMAVMINFVDEPVALIMPLFFGAVSLGTAFQARKASERVALTLQKGTAAVVHGSPRLNRGLWDFGAFSVPKDGQLKTVLSEGAPTTVALAVDVRRVLSVNNVPLKKPVTFGAAPGFETLLSASPPQRTQAVSRAQAPSQEDLPPPPEGWGARFCPQCGEPVSGDYMFCRKCGLKLKA